MNNIEEELKKQNQKIDEIKSDISLMKKVYLTSLILKIVIILIPIIGIILSIPKFIEIYKEFLI